MESEDLDVLVAEEFERIGFMCKPRDVANLADALRAQACEYGEIGIMAACVGYASAKGAKF